MLSQVTLGLQLCWDAGVKLVVAGQKLQSAGVVVDMFPLHNQEKLKSLCEAWYSGNQLSQPLGEGMHMGNLKAQQMLACFCFCCPAWSTIEFSQHSHQTLHCFIQIQSTSISETLWPTTSVSWISTPGLCFHRQCWAWSSHTSLVGVKIYSFIYSYSFNFSCIVYFATET